MICPSLRKIAYIISAGTAVPFPGGAGYPAYWVSILTRGIFECGIQFVFGDGSRPGGGIFFRDVAWIIVTT